MKDNMRAIRRAHKERVIANRFKTMKLVWNYSLEDRYVQDLVVGKYAKNRISGSCSCFMCRNPRRNGYKTLKEEVIDDIFHNEMLLLKYE